MKGILGFLAALLVLAWAGVAQSQTVDGGPCDATVQGVNKGVWNQIACINICDDVDEGETCAEYDLQTFGISDQIIFDIIENDDQDCSDSGGPQMAIQTGPTTGGSPAREIDSSAVVLNDTTPRVVVITKDAPLDRYLFFAFSLDTACTDVDVRARFVNRKTE